MERVAFLIEDTGERIGCLLNPESLVMRRQAGVRSRQSTGGLITGVNLADDQLLYCGGGNTELTMNLLFDVTLTGSSISTEDVRDLTAPLWRLAENSQKRSGYANPPICHFVWGKSWHIPGIVRSVAEKFEFFTKDGIPRRSLIRLLFRRVLEPIEQKGYATAAGPQRTGAEHIPDFQGFGEQVESHEVLSGERPDQIGHTFYDDPAKGRVVMSHNKINDPLRIPAGTILELPSAIKLEDLL